MCSGCRRVRQGVLKRNNVSILRSITAESGYNYARDKRTGRNCSDAFKRGAVAFVTV